MSDSKASAMAPVNLREQGGRKAPTMNLATPSSSSSPSLFSLKSAAQLGADTVAAAVASLLVSPFITVIDRAIIENASGKVQMWPAIRQYGRSFFSSPLRFMTRKEFGLVFGLYFATYATANYVDTVCEKLEKDPMVPKFIGTSFVNVGLVLVKDRAFTRMFGVGPPKPLPMITYGLFAIRDSLTNVASFSCPALLSSKLQNSMELSSKTSDTAAQLISPSAVQFISTPLHLIGVEFYNNAKSSVGSHLSLIRREYWRSLAARVGRIGPAFGFGGLGNNHVRSKLRHVFENLDGAFFSPSAKPIWSPSTPAAAVVSPPLSAVGSNGLASVAALAGSAAPGRRALGSGMVKTLQCLSADEQSSSSMR